MQVVEAVGQEVADNTRTHSHTNTRTHVHAILAGSSSQGGDKCTSNTATTSTSSGAGSDLVPSSSMVPLHDACSSWWTQIGCFKAAGEQGVVLQVAMWVEACGKRFIMTYFCDELEGMHITSCMALNGCWTHHGLFGTRHGLGQCGVAAQTQLFLCFFASEESWLLAQVALEVVSMHKVAE
eukprot:1157985-Pelagomonas_calceolata.AAC.6